MVKRFQEFHNELNKSILTGKEVSEYIIDITPNEEDIPHFFLNIIKKHNFELKEISILSLLGMDPSFKEYYDAHDIDNSRYSDFDIENGIIHEDDIYNPIVIVDNEILDGYNRVTILGKRGERYIKAYINI